MTVPIEMPALIAGAGETPERGACVMQAAAWLASDGKQWNDAPDCVHSTLRRVAIWVNDRVGDGARGQLWPLIPRLLGTATDDRKADIRTAVQLAVWSAERALPLIKDPVTGERAAERLGAARAWLDKGEKPAAAADYAYAAADYAYAAAAYAYAAADYAYAAAAYAYAYAADAAYAYAAAAAAAAAADAAADAADAADAALWDGADERKIAFLVELIDKHAELTGHQPQEVDPARWEALRRAMLGERV